MDYYRNLLTEKRKKNTIQIRIHIDKEEVNIRIKDMKRAIISLRNGRMCGLKGIRAEHLKSETEKLYRILGNIINQYLNGHPIPD
jgi:hypothetical protein